MLTRKLNEQQERELVRRYLSGEEPSKLKLEYGFKRKKSITDKVKKYGYKTFTRSERECFNKPHRCFSVEKVDSPFKAYWLGLMITDGWIDKRGTIYLSMSDKDVIEFVSKILGKKYTVIKKDGALDQYRIAFNSPDLLKQIEDRGIHNNKSKTKRSVAFSPEEEKYYPYYIRGVIDGDGWIRKDGGEFFICSGSLEFINDIKDILYTKLYMVDLNVIEVAGSWAVRSAQRKNMNILRYIVFAEPYGMARKFNVLHEKISETTMGGTK